MKVAVTDGPMSIRLEDRAVPEPGADQVLVRVKAAGVCGSDLHFHRSGSTCAPRRLGGHEYSGVVEAVGQEVANATPGDRVAVEPLMGCQQCSYCLRGDYHLCPSLTHVSEGFGEFALVPAANVYKIADHVSLEEASVLDCVAVGVHAMQRCLPRLCDRVVVIGDAAIGLSCVACARAQGAGQVIVAGHHQSNLERAQQCGADVAINATEQDAVNEVFACTAGAGADVVYETVGGASSSLTAACAMVRPGGTIVIVGCFTKTPELDMSRLMRHEVNLLFSWSYARWNGVPEFQIAMDLLTSGRIATLPFISHRFPLDQLHEAFACAMNKHGSGALKVLVCP